ncbi:MAG: glucosamine-6-phosphate deaminase [Eubacteriales bacterium]|nr:glucosamine-6-phosphate deaminase [Eubacteriales bacterium]
MQIHTYDTAAQVGQAAAILIGAQVLQKPESVLGLATGSSPIPTYQELIRLYQAGVLDFSHATAFNLDEYCQLPAGHPCSYRYFMDQELFAHINLPAERTHIPDGNAPDLEGECARYDRKIAEAGSIDLQLLGIGRNGHIGFNEPSDQFVYGCHVVALTKSTIEANRRFFDREEDVPRRAVSLGVGSIMNAKSVLLIATGGDKATAVRKSILEDIDPGTQASILRTHPNAIFLLDRAAASRL